MVVQVDEPSRRIRSIEEFRLRSRHNGMDGSQQGGTNCKTKMMKEVPWAWARATPPLCRVRYLRKTNKVILLWIRQSWRLSFFGKIFLLVLGPCSEVPLSGPPSPIEGHNRDHLEETHQLAKDLDIEVTVNCSTAEQMDTDCRPQWRWCRSRPRTWRRRSPTHQSGRQCSRYKSWVHFNNFLALLANLLCVQTDMDVMKLKDTQYQWFFSSDLM